MKSCAHGQASSGRTYSRGRSILYGLKPLSYLPRYYIDQPSVVITGTPSAKLAEKIDKDETLRIEEQVKALGPAGIKKKAEALEAAIAEHDRPIPNDILTSFPLPAVESISWIPVESVQEPGRTRERRSNSDKLSRHIESDGSELPFFVQYDHVEVNHSFYE